MRSTIRAAMREDSGIAMLVVIGVMSVVTILGVSSFVLARQTLHESERVEDSSRAFRVASSGLESKLSTLQEDEVLNFPTEGITGSTEDGTYELHLVDLDRNEFELVSIGQGLDGSTETVRQRFFFLNLWKMNISADSEDSLITGGNRMNGNSHIIGPFYVKGSLNIQANMGVFEGPLFVKTQDGGIYPKNNNFYLGHPDYFIDVYCDTLDIPENRSAANSGVYVRTRSASVPDIMLPPLTQEHLELWAEKARQESVDNKMGSTNQDNYEAVDGDPSTYYTMQPPNTASFQRKKAPDATGDNSDYYKFFGSNTGLVSDKGTGSTHLTIGNTTFGAWGALTDVNGMVINSTAGPSGVGSYPANAHDGFAYDATRNILFISGTVFVDGPVTFSKGMTYVGNGTIVANGDITVNGHLRPYGTNAQAEENKWALGLVTPGDIDFKNHDSSNPGSPRDPDLREKIEPSWAGAFYAEQVASFPKTNSIFYGSLLAGHMDFGGPLNFIITNPMLPSYLPDSLPGGDMSMLLPTHWSRN